MVDVADLIDDDDFVLAMARFADGVWTESQIKRKFRFDDTTWQKLGSDDRLVEKIEALKELRIRHECRRFTTPSYRRRSGVR